MFALFRSHVSEPSRSWPRESRRSWAYCARARKAAVDPGPAQAAAPEEGGTPPAQAQPRGYWPRDVVDASGFWNVIGNLTPWKPDASLETIRALFDRPGQRLIPRCDDEIAAARRAASGRDLLGHLITKALLLNSEGETEKAYHVLEEARSVAVADEVLASQMLLTLSYLQGVTALRRGENDNCVLCRGESSCILPLAPAAIHANPAGSRLAVRHFTEISSGFPTTSRCAGCSIWPT